MHFRKKDDNHYTQNVYFDFGLSLWTANTIPFTFLNLADPSTVTERFSLVVQLKFVFFIFSPEDVKIVPLSSRPL